MISSEYHNVQLHEIDHFELPDARVVVDRVFLEVTNNTMQLLKAVRSAVEALWEPGYRYSKAGFITQNLVPPALVLRSHFDNLDHDRTAKLMAAMDTATRSWGRNTVLPAAVGVPSRTGFTTKFDRRSPRYITRWEETPICK